MAKGRTLTEGTVADTCEAAGMKAVCTGPSGCRHNSARCEVVDFEAVVCGSAMYGLSKKLCGFGEYPRNCAKLDGLFSHTVEMILEM